MDKNKTKEGYPWMFNPKGNRSFDEFFDYLPDEVTVTLGKSEILSVFQPGIIKGELVVSERTGHATPKWKGEDGPVATFCVQAFAIDLLILLNKVRQAFIDGAEKKRLAGK